MFTEVWYGQAWEHSDSTGWHFIASGVKSVSAGQQGIIDYLTTGGNAYWHNESGGSDIFLGSNVAQVTAGTDQYGGAMVDVLFNGGLFTEWRASTGWNTMAYNGQYIGKAHAGTIDFVLSGGWTYDSDGYNWYFLSINGQTAA